MTHLSRDRSISIVLRHLHPEAAARKHIGVSRLVYGVCAGAGLLSLADNIMAKSSTTGNGVGPSKVDADMFLVSLPRAPMAFTYYH